ncbi:MAG: hypothetical protein HYX75_14805 [Acidobacteria bacterium]|nr:hypothetical protein [Acidobacteriota bacterium]
MSPVIVEFCEAAKRLGSVDLYALRASMASADGIGEIRGFLREDYLRTAL